MISVKKGFSAAELLIALFVGAAFILTGYQLYGIIAQDNGASRSQAIASDIAYSTLRIYAGNVGATCSVSGLQPVSIPSSVSLPGQATMFESTTCPYGTSSTISEVTVYVYYGSSYSGVVEHAILASQG